MDFGGGEQPYISVHGLVALAEIAGEFGGWGKETHGPVKQFKIGSQSITAPEWVQTDVYKIIRMNNKDERVLCNGPIVFFDEEVRVKKDKDPNNFWLTRPRSMLSKNSRRRTILANFQSLAKRKNADDVDDGGQFTASVTNENVIDLSYSDQQVDPETGEVLNDAIYEDL